MMLYLDFTAKEKKVNLDKKDKVQIILSSFFKKDDHVKTINTYGEWAVKICVGEINPDMKHVILTRRFLILPSVSSQHLLPSVEHLWPEIQLFWDFEVICIKSVQNLALQSTFLYDKFFSSCDKSYWSTFYPDPKSDIRTSLFVDEENRII